MDPPCCAPASCFGWSAELAGPLRHASLREICTRLTRSGGSRAAARWSVSRRRCGPRGQKPGRSDRSGAQQDDVAARQLEETLDIRRVFRAPRAFTRHAPVQAELTAPTDG